MANEHSGVKFFIIYTIITILLVPCTVFAKEDEAGDSTLFEFAKSLLQESVRNQRAGSGLTVLDGIVQGFMQSEGGKQLGNMLSSGQKNNIGMEFLSSLGSLWQAAKAGSNESPSNPKAEESGFDPSVVGTMIDLFTTLSKAADDGNRQNTNEREERSLKENEKGDEGSVDWEALLSLAGNFISSMNGNQEKDHGSGSRAGFESVLSFLPVLLSSLSGQHNIHASKSIPHHSHDQFLPPILENLHEYWDHFSNSELGKTLWENSGLSKLVQIFTDSKGEFEFEKIFKSLENNSFRRMWVKSISSFVAEWVKYLTDPNVQGRYLDTVQLVCNSFLKAQGYPKNLQIDLNRPAESISAITNAIFKRQFNLNVNSEIYVKPAISYIQDIVILAQKKSYGVSRLSTKDIESKLAETLDADVIEPVLRVNRAFKFGSNRSECAKYVICAINQQPEANKSGIKPGITKLASLGASWFLSRNSNIQFWDLYNAAVEDRSCTKYDKMCSEFHSEDLKATTEYFHNEL